MSIACPACASPRSRQAARVGDLRFRRCRECRSLWVADPPPDGATQTLYGDRLYFSNPDLFQPGATKVHGYKDYLGDRPHIEVKFREALEHLERYVEPGRLLDVGAGPGFLVGVAGRRGWEARGVEPNAWAVAHARDQLGLAVSHGTLADGGFEEESFDALTMMDVIEHVADPEALLREAARVTRPGGALAMLTPDAGSPVSRALGARWPEIKRAPEHLVLLSVDGAVRLLARCGWDALGWHSVGKTSRVETLLADVGPAAPALARALGPAVTGTALGGVELELDPRTKFVLYARRRHSARASRAVCGEPPARLPKRVRASRATDQAVLEDLRGLARARRLCDWMFEQHVSRARGEVVEVGAGIGTFSARALAAGAERMLLLEPADGCASELERRFAADRRVTVAREQVPESDALAARAGQVDWVLCQNVLEHIEDHRAAVEAMAAALRPGGTLSLLVPATPRLYGSLDVAYGHWRRYSPELLRDVVAGADLEITELYYFNALGVPGWWLKRRTGSTEVGTLALRAYEALVVPWRALEHRLRPPFGLSLIAHGRKVER